VTNLCGQMGSRLLPLVLALATLAAAGAGLPALALWLGLALVPAAASSAFLAVSDVLEGRPATLRAVTTGLALALAVLASAARENTPAGASAPSLATYAIVLALLAYAVPAVLWVLEPVRVPQSSRESRRPVEAEIFAKAS
jgi:hypothetical protein